MSTAQLATQVGRATFAFICVTVLLDKLALDVVIPALPELVVDFLADETAREATQPAA